VRGTGASVRTRLSGDVTALRARVQDEISAVNRHR
jgi:hypothetical protein